MRSRFCVVLVLLVASCGYAQHSFSTDKLMADLKILSTDSMEGRKTGSEGNKKARVYIVNQLKEMGAKPYASTDYLQSFTITQSLGRAEQRHGVNILAVINGKKKETIVVSAHYDHVGIIRNAIYNGADDNASGTAALLTFINYFQKNIPNHRVIFAFFDAEEIGLQGSAHFVNTIELKKENIVLNINMDMISRSDKNELYACGTHYYPDLRSPLESLQVPSNFKLLFGHDDPSSRGDNWTNQSDQKNFHNKNIPFLYFGVEDHADYHKPTDTFEKINPDFYASSTETILRAILVLDKSLE